MSWVSGYVRRQVRRHGVTGYIVKVLEFIAKITTSKKDDAMVADIKSFVENYSSKKKSKSKPK
jgi:hypothetical protein|tara:strand:+ start:10062 stop:10250 length:189 start_codon:yes stop_codon:yes gene_type:complete